MKSARQGSFFNTSLCCPAIHCNTLCCWYCHHLCVWFFLQFCNHTPVILDFFLMSAMDRVYFCIQYTFFPLKFENYKRQIILMGRSRILTPVFSRTPLHCMISRDSLRSSLRINKSITPPALLLCCEIAITTSILCLYFAMWLQLGKTYSIHWAQKGTNTDKQVTQSGYSCSLRWNTDYKVM